MKLNYTKKGPKRKNKREQRLKGAQDGRSRIAVSNETVSAMNFEVRRPDCSCGPEAKGEGPIIADPIKKEREYEASTTKTPLRFVKIQEQKGSGADTSSQGKNAGKGIEEIRRSDSTEGIVGTQSETEQRDKYKGGRGNRGREERKSEKQNADRSIAPRGFISEWVKNGEGTKTLIEKDSKGATHKSSKPKAGDQAN